MSIVEQIKTAIESYISSNLPEFAKAPYNWTVDLNSYSKKRYFAVRTGAATFVNGTCRTITIDQSFEIELSASYNNRGDTENDADSKIMELYAAHETIYRNIMRDNFNIGRVQVVSALDIDAPLVDNENKACRILATYTIKYRTE